MGADMVEDMVEDMVADIDQDIELPSFEILGMNYYTSAELHLR